MRSSGDVSIRKTPSGVRSATPVRVRLLRGLVDEQTGQWHPMMGTPWLVPVPSRINSREELIGADIDGASRGISSSKKSYRWSCRRLYDPRSVTRLRRFRSRTVSNQGCSKRKRHPGVGCRKYNIYQSEHCGKQGCFRKRSDSRLGRHDGCDVAQTSK